ncbi:hypothetical protein BDQ12DRAFT_716160 [Crucibulum laeve]|uniref:Uncharacterized protein n=1 Tax=Crucibulum laeve TaxID=68775 RepID=A0A5C3LJJ2_9AGAR|nr:hypothetical protein BDQ12DRAFT_716160 [Crucibulum laeve]
MTAVMRARFAMSQSSQQHRLNRIYRHESGSGAGETSSYISYTMAPRTESTSDVVETPGETSPGSPTAAPLVESLILDTPPQIHSQRSNEPQMWKILKLIAMSSFPWVEFGIAVMLLGIGIVQVTLLPRIYTCPRDATCPNSFDPNNTNVLQLTQALMAYWLKAGIIITAFGLLKLSAYQSWFIMMKHGNTIENLDLNLGAIKGSVFDAARLLLRRGNSWLSLFVLVQIGISTAISLIVGFSIIRVDGIRTVTFIYRPITNFPASDRARLNDDSQVIATAKVMGWALANDTGHDFGLRGSLVFPDGRSNQTVHPVSGGRIIGGNMVCGGVSNYSILSDSDNVLRYEITVGPKIYRALPDFRLAVSMTSFDTAITRYLWVSNTFDILPNATLSSDGKMYFALCNHTLFMTNNTVDAADSVQEVNANIPYTSGCNSTDPYTCVADSVNNAILNWWGGIGTSFWKLSCRGGVLGPVKPNQNSCALTKELWTETATSVLDGIMQTAVQEGSATQVMDAHVKIISMKFWWLQGLIPLAALILYAFSLWYTVLLSEGNDHLKKLNLSEVITASQTDHVRTLVDSGRLKKSIVRYGGDTGFVRDNSNSSEQ